MSETTIEWTEHTWNPVRGCTEISPGCAHCYAAEFACRFNGPGQPYEGLAYRDANGKAHWTGRLKTVPDKLAEPLKRRKPTTWFVNSMSDLFHEDLSLDFIADVFAVMAMTPQHTYQILTKRADRLQAIMDRKRYFELGVLKAAHKFQGMLSGGWPWPLLNVWLGVSVENQKTADERIPYLLKTPAAIRFLSVEPLLGPVEFSDVTKRSDAVSQLGKKSLDGIGWVIAGGESGRNARPMHPQWVRSIRDQCVAAGVPFFFKQHGEWSPVYDFDAKEHVQLHVDGRTKKGLFPDHSPGWEVMNRIGKKAAGRLLDGREWNEIPEL